MPPTEPRRIITPNDPERVLARLDIPPCQFGGHPNSRMRRVRIDGTPSRRGGFVRCPCGLTLNRAVYSTVADAVDRAERNRHAD